MHHRRNPRAPIVMTDMTLRDRGLGRHGPASFVGAPRRSLGYAFVAPPRIRGRGAPGTRASARVAGCSPFRSPF